MTDQNMKLQGLKKNMNINFKDGTVRKSRKDRICKICNRKINVGESYVHYSELDGKNFVHYDAHTDCLPKFNELRKNRSNKASQSDSKIKASNVASKKREFDLSKIIIDPKKLIKGNEYYTSGSKSHLLSDFKEDLFRVFSGVISENGLYGKFDGTEYQLFYPREPIVREKKYQPYDFSKLGFDNLKSWLGKKVRILNSSETFTISSINNIASLTIGVSNDFSKCEREFTEKVFFDLCTWENGSPCGQEIEQ